MADFTTAMAQRSKQLFSLRWIGPYLLVPILFIASLVIESWLQESGVMAYIPVGRRSSYSLWRVLMLTSMVAAPLMTLFMAETRKLLSSSHSRGFSATHASTFVSVLLSVLIVMILISFIVLKPLGVSTEFILANLFWRALLAAFWSVCTATLCSVISSGHGGAVLSLGLFSISLFPGLSGNSMSWWFVAPLGSLVTERAAASVPAFAVFCHAAAYLVLGSLMLRKTNR